MHLFPVVVHLFRRVLFLVLLLHRLLQVGLLRFLLRHLVLELLVLSRLKGLLLRVFFRHAVLRHFVLVLLQVV